MATALQPLNERQKRFVDEYLVDLAAGPAARRAGYSKSCATVMGYRMLRLPHIRAAVDAQLAARQARVQVTQDRVLQELSRIAFADMGDYYTAGADGQPVLDLRRLTKDQTTAIAELTVTDLGEAQKEEPRHARRVRIKLADKLGALALLGRHLGMFREKHEHTGVEGGPVNVIVRNYDFAQILAEEARKTIEGEAVGGD